MAISEKIITSFPYIITPQANDSFLAVHNPNNAPNTMLMSYGTMFANITVITNFGANVTTSNNTIFQISTLQSTNFAVANSYTPSSSSDSSIPTRSIWFDSNYLYVCISPGTIKRVALGSF